MTNRQRLFLEEYLKCGNATESAKKAGYSQKTAYAQGQRLLKKAEVQQALQQRLSDKVMAANEVLERITAIARNEASTYVRAPAEGKPYLDVAAMIQDGKTHLIKGITYTRSGDAVIETFDSLAALVNIGRHYKLFTDKMEVDDSELTDEERAARITALLDAARARRTGSPPGSSGNGDPVT